MSSNRSEHLTRILTELKGGTILTKRKRNGEKYSRRFFLDEHESFISYHQSEKVFAQSHRYEIRAGFHTRTFDRLVRREIIEPTDVNKSGTLTKRECRRLLTDSLNAKVPEDVFEKLFQETDTSGEGLLTPDEFINFFRVLTRRTDLYEIMQKYVKNGDEQTIETISMNANELLYFLQIVQNQTIIQYQSKQSKDIFSLQPIATYEHVQDLINEFEPNIELQEKGLLSLNGLYYFYLFNTQVSGESNPEAYNRALRAGCRAVEIDCYDGDDGQPIVKHGYTFVKSCRFESIIRFIEPNLFKTSPYPVILDLENHCSIEQQYQMAQILKQILGDRLIIGYSSTKTSGVLPSPEDLKYKVVVRGIKIPTSTTSPKLSQQQIIGDNNSFFNRQSTFVEHHLIDVYIYLQNVPYSKYEYANEHYICFHSPSLSERELKQVCRSDPIGLMKQTQKCLLRMYPDGLRQDSSNPNPVDAWNFGIQMVALNYQNDDHMMELCYGKFIDNGGCGYVLKPNYLINLEKSKYNPFDYLKQPLILSKDINEYPQRLILTIISGQFLCRSSEKTDDIPDPYVIISTHGILCDQQIKKTKFIENNGFNPIWNETFQFDIYFPQMCLVRFDVYDYDIFTRDDRLAYFCLPMTTMQTGYRHIHLRAKNNNPTHSTLFIHVAIEKK
ncbi:unnamed protein product [Rotaria sp. Silwood2]|nr:unnamed protein product [Rotaria sp. Silwood2]